MAKGTSNKPAKQKADINKGKVDAGKTPPAPPEKVKHIVTEEDLIKNPDLATQGIKVVDTIDIDAPIAPAASAGEKEPPKGNDKDDKKVDKLKDILKPYVNAYPNNKVFHITSDGQVFLNENKADAESHEKTLGGELKVYNV